MRRVVERFGSAPLAYLVLEGLLFGQVYHRGVGVRRYCITCRTAGGHAWVDYGQPSAIHELAALITRLTALPLPSKPHTTLNVGVVQGGTSVNSLAAEAWLELDLRSEQSAALAELITQVETQVRASQRLGVSVQIEVVGNRPTGELPPDHPLVRLAVRCLQTQGVAEPILTTGSTDANLPLSLGYPAVCVGLANGRGAHSPGEEVFTANLPAGLAQLLCLVRGIFDALA
jgi:acetylornithine deacetylase/succinyl-diaminopimelate desuccinylase-like protein